MKHIYLHTSKMENTSVFRGDSDFESYPNYSILDKIKLLHKEYGRIKTNDAYYHILVGSIAQEGCPWCNGTPEIFKIGKSRGTGYTAYCIQCDTCGSRGPTLNITESIHLKDKDLDEYMEFMWNRYKFRKNWDNALVNPYEGNS